MLKNMIITLILLCAYLSLLILFKQVGFNNNLNLILSSMLLGMGMAVWVGQCVYIVSVAVLLSVLFAAMQDFISIPMMLSSLVFGDLSVYFVDTQLQKYVRAQRRPKNENREFLN